MTYNIWKLLLLDLIGLGADLANKILHTGDTYFSRLVRIVALIPTWIEKASKGVGLGESIYFLKIHSLFFWNPWTFMIYQEAETFMRALDIYFKKNLFRDQK